MDVDSDKNINEKSLPTHNTTNFAVENQPRIMERCQCDYIEEWESDGDYCPGAGEAP